jgi:hypothetical protein
MSRRNKAEFSICGKGCFLLYIYFDLFKSFSVFYIFLKKFSHFNHWHCQIGGEFMPSQNQFAELLEEEDAFWPLRWVDQLVQVQVAVHNDAQDCR